MACTYGVGEAGIIWEITLQTVNEEGETVSYTIGSADGHKLEFRRPDGTFVERDAEYERGMLTYDQGDDTTLLNMPGRWQFRGVIRRGEGAEIKSPYWEGFWVVP